MTNKDHLDKVVYLNPTTSNRNNGKIDSEEVGNMNKETYSKTEIDLKLQNLETKVDNQFTLLNDRLESSTKQIVSETKNMLNELQLAQYKEREAERKATNKWFIGLLVTIGIALFKLFFP